MKTRDTCDSPWTRTGKPCGNSRKNCPNRADHDRIRRERQAVTAATVTATHPAPAGRGHALVAVAWVYDFDELDEPALERAVAEMAERDYELPDRIQTRLEDALDERELDGVDVEFEVAADEPAAGHPNGHVPRVTLRLHGGYSTDATPPGAPGSHDTAHVELDGATVTVRWNTPPVSDREREARAAFEGNVTDWHTGLVTELSSRVVEQWQAARDPETVRARAERYGWSFTAEGVPVRGR